MTIAAVMAALLLAQAPDVRIERVPLGTITIPNEISPAITPYFDCLMASRGVATGPPGPDQVAPSKEQVGADCSHLRLSSRRRAEDMLRAQRRGSRAERRAYVERVLANVDRFAAALPVPGQSLESRPDAQNR